MKFFVQFPGREACRTSLKGAQGTQAAIARDLTARSETTQAMQMTTPETTMATMMVILTTMITTPGMDTTTLVTMETWMGIVTATGGGRTAA